MEFGKNVLYCGMADDIMAPLLLVPHLKKIFVISLFDKAFSSGGTWESQKFDIIKTLLNGGKRCSFWKQPSDGGEFHALKSKSKIIQIKENFERKRWVLEFEYENISRKLIYYYDRNFLGHWPAEIQSIGVLITIGAYDIREMEFEKGKEENTKHKLFRDMIKMRCNKFLLLCTETYRIKHNYGNHRKLYLNHGHIRAESRIGLKIINTEKLDDLFGYCPKTGINTSDYEDQPPYPEYLNDLYYDHNSSEEFE